MGGLGDEKHLVWCVKKPRVLKHIWLVCVNTHIRKSVVKIYALIAQLVERQFCKLDVASSNLAGGTSFLGRWQSGPMHRSAKP